MSDPRITIRLSPRYAALLALNADGWLDAGACDDGLEPAEREALYSTYTQIIRGLKRHGLTLATARALAATEQARPGACEQDKPGAHWSDHNENPSRTGILCAGCGGVIDGRAPGHPRYHSAECEPQRPFPCTDCLRSFDDSNGLFQHRKAKH